MLRCAKQEVLKFLLPHLNQFIELNYNEQKKFLVLGKSNLSGRSQGSNYPTFLTQSNPMTTKGVCRFAPKITILPELITLCELPVIPNNSSKEALAEVISILISIVSAKNIAGFIVVIDYYELIQQQGHAYLQLIEQIRALFLNRTENLIDNCIFTVINTPKSITLGNIQSLLMQLLAQQNELTAEMCGDLINDTLVLSSHNTEQRAAFINYCQEKMKSENIKFDLAQLNAFNQKLLQNIFLEDKFQIIASSLEDFLPQINLAVRTNKQFQLIENRFNNFEQHTESTLEFKQVSHSSADAIHMFTQHHGK